TAIVVIATATPTAVPPTPTCVPWGIQGTRSVVVGPDIHLCNPDCLSISYMDTVTWTGNTVEDLWIEFPDKPFQNMYPGTIKPNRANCSGNSCQSGPIIPTAPTGWYPCPNYPTSKCKDFKYWQTFHNNSTGKNTTADGRIIIKW